MEVAKTNPFLTDIGIYIKPYILMGKMTFINMLNAAANFM